MTRLVGLVLLVAALAIVILLAVPAEFVTETLLFVALAALILVAVAWRRARTGPPDRRG